jgi:hypothetical protein
MWMVGVVALGWLVEPTQPVTLGLVALLLGASVQQRYRASGVLTSARVWAPAAVVGVFFGLWALIADFMFLDAVESASAQNFTGIMAWYRLDPMAASVVSDASITDAMHPTQDQLEISRTWAQRAVDLDPDNPTWRANLALVELRLDHLDAARRSADDALAINDANLLALQVLEILAHRTGDDHLLAKVTVRLCQIDPNVCPPPTDSG